LRRMLDKRARLMERYFSRGRIEGRNSQAVRTQDRFVLNCLRERFDGCDMHLLTVEEHDRLISQNAVEDTHDLGVEVMVTMISHRDTFGEPLGLVVDAANADRVDV